MATQDSYVYSLGKEDGRRAVGRTRIAARKAPSSVFDDTDAHNGMTALGHGLGHIPSWQGPETRSKVINSVRAPIPSGYL